MKTILAPIDFSSITDQVVREASSLAAAIGARVVLLTALQPPILMAEDATIGQLAEIAAAGEKNATRQLEAVAEKIRQQPIAVTTVPVTDHPVPAILAQAVEWKADYIVMGSHGHSAFYDLLVGSTTHGVLNGATCPVVIVPASKLSPAAAGPRE